MTEYSAAKNVGDLTRIITGQGTIEHDWKLVRFEPETGNAICEKDNKRVSCRRGDFEILNFPCSDALWETIQKDKSESDDLVSALRAWEKLDLSGLRRHFLHYAASLDPSLNGTATFDDLKRLTKQISDRCRRGLELLKIDVKKAEREYSAFPARTALEYDAKDNLLAHWRDMENKYAAKKYRAECLIPALCRLSDALACLIQTEEQAKKQ
jgi:hypothetical protein